MRRPAVTAAVRGRRRRLSATATAGVLVIGLAGGCNDDNSDGESVIDDPPTSDTTPASTVPTAEPKTTKEKAVEAAKQAISDYRSTDYEVARQPRAISDQELRQVAVGGGYNDISNDRSYYSRNGYRAIGAPKIVDISVQWVKLAHKPNQQPPLIPTVLIDICNDVSGTNVVDKTGHSVVDPARPDRFAMSYWVSNYDWPNPDGWRVSETETELTTCAR
jgi:hypothetical protein